METYKTYKNRKHIKMEKGKINLNLKGKRKKFLKNWQLTPYAIIFGQRTFFSIIKLVFRRLRII